MERKKIDEQKRGVKAVKIEDGMISCILRVMKVFLSWRKFFGWIGQILIYISYPRREQRRSQRDQLFWRGSQDQLELKTKRKGNFFQLHFIGNVDVPSNCMERREREIDGWKMKPKVSWSSSKVIWCIMSEHIDTSDQVNITKIRSKQFSAWITFRIPRIPD